MSWFRLFACLKILFDVSTINRLKIPFKHPIVDSFADHDIRQKSGKILFHKKY